MRRVALMLLVLPVAVIGGCTREDNAVAPVASPTVTSTNGRFAPYAPGATAVTYDQKLVPEGATAAVTITETENSNRVRLTVAGLVPSHRYGAHLHLNPCGATGEAAGPHFQHRKDPAASASHPSVNPSYANAQNEVWLDFTTDAEGRAASATTHPWTFGPNPPRSLIIHERGTSTAPGEAGMAGERAACLTLPK